MAQFAQSRIQQKTLKQRLNDLDITFDSIDDLQHMFGVDRVYIDPEKRIHPVRFKSEDYNAMLKVKLFNNEQESISWIKKIYEVYSDLKKSKEFDMRNIMPLLTDEALTLGTQRGVLMPLGECNLSKYGLVRGEEPSEEELLFILMQIMNGTRKFHLKSYKHKDFKPSQFILEELLDDWRKQNWWVSDYEQARVTDDTATEKNSSIFRSPGFWREHYERISKKGQKPFVYSEQEDLFNIGLSIFMVRTKTYQGFQTDQGTYEERHAYIKKTIQKAGFSKAFKYHLLRLLNPEFPQGKVKDNDSHKYRYPTAQAAWEELSQPFKGTNSSFVLKGKPIDKKRRTKKENEDQSDPKKSSAYENFNTTATEFNRLLEIAKASKRNDLGFISPQQAYELQQKQKKLFELKNNPLIAHLQDVQTTCDTIANQYREEILFPEIENIKNKLDYLRSLGEKINKNPPENEKEKQLVVQELIDQVTTYLLPTVQRAEIYAETDLIHRNTYDEYSLDDILNYKTPLLRKTLEDIQKSRIKDVKKS